MTSAPSNRVVAVAAGMIAAAMLCLGGGCGSSFKRIDDKVDRLLADTSQSLGGDAPPAAYSSPTLPESMTTAERRRTRAADHPPTNNPAAEQLRYHAAGQAGEVTQRLAKYNEIPEGAKPVDLAFALSWSAGHAREYQFAAEEYVLAALRLLIEDHLWGPRFFDEVSALLTSTGDDGFYETSLSLVNEFRVTQRLPYGGEVSARALARATEDLHNRIEEDVQTADLILRADIPLLRGAGLIAQEDRIQARRNLVYAAREFEQFRRDFFFDIAQDFLDLVVQQKSVVNAENQVNLLLKAEQREQSLYDAGRSEYFQLALAKQSTASAQDSLNSRRESYRLAVDRFKIRIGLPADQPVVITPSTFELPKPNADMEDAVQAALLYRLDLQNERDRVDDARRGLDNARNNLLPDLNATGTAAVVTDRTREFGGVDFDFDSTAFTAGVTFGLPLDREIERVNIRQAQIQLERAHRNYERSSDDISVTVRSTVRDIDRALYTSQIQERSVEVGQRRQASIAAAPDRATTRDINDAANELAQAEDDRDSAQRDLQVAILRYLRETGQLRVNRDGTIRPLAGMEAVGILTHEPPVAATTQPDLLPGTRPVQQPNPNNPP